MEEGYYLLSESVLNVMKDKKKSRVHIVDREVKLGEVINAYN